MDLLPISYRERRKQCVSNQKFLRNEKSNKIEFFFLTALVHPENQLNTFLAYSGVDAWRVIEVQPSQPNGK